MEYDLVSKKIGPNKHLVSNKITNEPVAFLSKPAHSYSKNEVEASWHPDFKLLHPEVDENLLTRNFPNKFDSVSNALGRLTYDSKPYVFGQDTPKDPVKTKYVGETHAQNNPAVKIHNWHMFDDEGKKIGSFTSRHGPNSIHANSEVSAIWDKEYTTANPIPNSVNEAARKKHPGDGLEDTMKRLRYTIDNRDKEPRFIGTQSSKESNSHIYKTKLSPEDASKAYEEHLKGTIGSGYTFQRHSPTIFSAHKPAASEYSRSYTHHVMAVPGELHHIISQFDHPKYEYGTRNTRIVESANAGHYRPISLESYLAVYKFVR